MSKRKLMDGAEAIESLGELLKLLDDERAALGDEVRSAESSWLGLKRCGGAREDHGAELLRPVASKLGAIKVLVTALEKHMRAIIDNPFAEECADPASEAVNTQTCLDAWPAFWSHNQPLYAKMVADGFKFKHGDKFAHFVDGDGEYANFPIGYITGPVRTVQGCETRYYSSVNGPDGWIQNSCSTRESSIAEALKVAGRLTVAQES